MDPTAHTVTVTASDDGESGGTVTVGFPVAFDLSVFTVGNEIEIKAMRQPDGTFVVRKIETENENDLADEADNEDNQPGANDDSSDGGGGDGGAEGN